MFYMQLYLGFKIITLQLLEHEVEHKKKPRFKTKLTIIQSIKEHITLDRYIRSYFVLE